MANEKPDQTSTTKRENTQAKKLTYAGKDYKGYLVVPGVPGKLDPRSWDQDFTTRMIAQYPRLERLFIKK